MRRIYFITLIIFFGVILLFDVGISGEKDAAETTSGKELVCVVKHEALDDDSSLVARELGLDVWRFKYEAPLDTKITVWTELYVDGKLKSSESRSYFHHASLEDEKHFGRFILTKYDPNITREEGTKKKRWRLSDTVNGQTNWIVDPFLGKKSIRFSFINEQVCKIGKTYTIFYTVEDDDKNMADLRLISEGNEVKIIENKNTCIFLKVRFDESKRRDYGGFGLGGIPDFTEKD